MTDLFPKFIIEDGNLIISKVTFHKEIVTEKEKVKGGGWFLMNLNNKHIQFYGDSYDFGEASFEDIKKAVEDANVYTDKYLFNNISSKFSFSYKNPAGEVTNIERIKKTEDE